MKNFLSIIVLGIVILISSGCPKTCIETNYSFIGNAHIEPDRDSIRVGDTIYLSSSFPVKLIDQGTGIEIDYTSAKNLGITLSVGRLTNGNTIPTDAVFDFNYFSVQGNVYNDRSIASPDAIQQLKYVENNNSYNLQIGIVAKSKGIYALGVGNGLSVGRANSKNCEKASFNISINNTNQHVYYYEKWRPGYNLTSSDIKRLYCFKVY